jgi:hypothetical protein
VQVGDDEAVSPPVSSDVSPASQSRLNSDGVMSSLSEEGSGAEALDSGGSTSSVGSFWQEDHAIGESVRGQMPNASHFSPVTPFLPR